jgi:predicted dehydrogenase
VQDGLIGKITSAHTWSNRPVWPQGIDRPAGSDPVPKALDWDLWLGVAAERPFVQGVYHPFKWRGWYDFGAGALGDMGCHIIDPVVWALELTSPLSVEYQGPQPRAESFPAQEVIRYRFPGTKHTAVRTLEMAWHDGGKFPPTEGSHVPPGGRLPDQGVMLVGEQGTLVCRHGGMPQLYPLEKFQDVNLPEVEPLDHYGAWVEAVRGGPQPSSNFAYAGPLTEIVLLGVVASRVGAEELRWDGPNLRFTNSDQANRHVREDYRTGWQVDGLS